MILDEKVRVYVAGLGNPSFILEDAHARGTKVMAIAGAVKHAKRFQEGGVDIVMAQGTDGGGHSSRIGTMVLVPQVVDAVSPTLVVAAGGIVDGRGLVANDVALRSCLRLSPASITSRKKPLSMLPVKMPLSVAV